MFEGLFCDRDITIQMLLNQIAASHIARYYALKCDTQKTMRTPFP